MKVKPASWIELISVPVLEWKNLEGTPWDSYWSCLPCTPVGGLTSNKHPNVYPALPSLLFTQSPLFNLTCSYGPNPGNHLSFLESDPGLALAWFPSHRTRETFLVQMLGLSSELTIRPIPFMFLVSSIPILEMLTPRTTATIGWLLSPRTHVSISLSFSPHPFLI